MTNKKKILFIDHDSQFTGSTISLIYLINAYQQAGYEVIIASVKGEDAIKKIKTSAEFRYVYLKKNYTIDLHFTNLLPIYTIKGILHFYYLLIHFIKGVIVSYKICLKYQPSIIYINEYVMAHFSIGARIRGIFSITHVRSPFLKGSFGLRKFLLSKLLTSFNNYIIAITYNEAKQIAGYVKNGDKILVIPEFLDSENFATIENVALIKKKLDIDVNKKVIVMTGGFEPVKGTFEFIKAIKILAELNTDFIVIISGYMRYKDFNNQCLNYIKNNKLECYFRIIGHTLKMTEILNITDVLVSPSTISHFSRPVLEAWALKKPVIVSDLHHYRDYIEDGVNGLYFKTGDSKDLARQLDSLLKNNDLAEKLGAAGFIKAKTIYGTNENIKKIIEISDRLVLNVRK